MGMSVLPDMYARSLRAAGPRAESIHIGQSTSAHVIINMLHFQHSQNLPKSLLRQLTLLIYSRMHIVIVGFYYDVGIMFYTL